LTFPLKYDIIIVPREREVINMAKSKKQLHEALRKKFLTHITEILTNEGEEVLLTKSNEISIPTLDEEGNEEFMVITFKVPTGSRDDGEAYDGYAIAEQYAESVVAKEEKAKAEAEKKARKIARDKAQREAKAKARAEHEAAKGEG
jgi:hypothetical protein